MTGNNKVWRAPVAGLASVAMLATMGVAVSTANADPAQVPAYNFTVTLDANGGKVNRQTSVQISPSAYADGIDLTDGYLNDLYKSYSVSAPTAQVFTGWYLGPNYGDEKFDYKDTFLNHDVTLYAHYAEPDDIVNITWDASKAWGVYDSSEILGDATFAQANSLTVSKKEKHIASWEIPTDVLGDSKVVADWKVNGGSDAVTFDQLASDFTGYLRYADVNAQKLDLTPGTVEDAASVSFAGFPDEDKEVAYGDTIDLPDGYNDRANSVVTVWDFQYTADSEPVSGQDFNGHVFRPTKFDTAYQVNFYTEIRGVDQKFAETHVVANSTVAQPTVPDRNDPYVLSMFTDSYQGGNHVYSTDAFDFSTRINADTNLVAQWSVDKVTITFDWNYAGKKSTKDYASGDTFSLPTDVTRDGYVLLGWYTKPNADTSFKWDGRKYVPAVQPTGDYVPTGAPLRINEYGYLQYQKYSKAPGQNGPAESPNKAVWVTIYTNTLYAAWAKGVNADVVDDYENRVTVTDEHGNYLSSNGYYTQASWDQYLQDFQAYLALKNQYGKDLTENEAATLLQMLQDAQAKLVEVGGTDLYRVYNPNNGDHYFTTDKAEYDALVKLGWQAEGVRYQVVGAKRDGSPKRAYAFGTPIWSVYNPNTGEHLLTDEGEADILATVGWTKEDVKFYTVQNGSEDVTRVYNPNTNGPAHLYTDASEANGLAAIGWNIDNDGAPVFTLD